jgi:transcriptional regulator with XRE-family HTH domain
MTFGQRLRELRLRRGFSQRHLATAVGVDVSYISKLENDRLPHTPSVPTIGAMADALGAEEVDLLAQAGKLPRGLTALAGTPQALEVMRVAGDRIGDAHGWQALLDYVESDEFERVLDATGSLSSEGGQS